MARSSPAGCGPGSRPGVSQAVGYFRFVALHGRLLALGFLLEFCASFGQTFFISLFGAEVRSQFSLTHSGFGTVYAVATLLSGATMLWAGRRIDDVDLRLFVAVIAGGLAAASLSMGLAPGVVVLCAAVFALRLFGQGLMPHAAATSMARYFGADRGKAIAVATLGHPAGAAVFPPLAVLAIAAIGWREAWLVGAGGLFFVALPLMLWLLRGHGARHLAHLAAEAKSPELDAWTQGRVLRDRRFYVLLFCVLALPFIFTGIIFHQVQLVAEKGWDLSWFAALYTLFAAASLVASLVTGMLVDRFGGLRLMPYFLLPSGGGLLALGLGGTGLAAAIYMALLGTSIGAANVVVGAMWAEVYGIRRLGSVRALAASAMVFSTAVSPPLFGLAIDAGVRMDGLALWCLGYVVAASVAVLSVGPSPGARARATNPG